MEVAALILSILALLVSVWSIWYSHRQAVAAEKANELAEKVRLEDRAAQQLRLDISVSMKQDGNKTGSMYFIVNIENNSNVIATLQSIAVISKRGKEYHSGYWEGQLEKAYSLGGNSGRLPATLEPGHSCTFMICDWKPDSVGCPVATSPDYEDPFWREVDRIELKANNQLFRAEGGPWQEQLLHGWSSTYWKPKP